MMWTAWVGLVEGKEWKPSLSSGVPTFQLRDYRHPSPVTLVRLKKNFFSPKLSWPFFLPDF